MSGDQVGVLLPLLLLVAAFWFLVLRPARNRQRQMSTLQAELTVGSTVMLASGVFGEVTWLGEETLRIEVAPGMSIRAHRHAIGRVLSAEEAAQLASESEDTSDAAPSPEATSSDPPSADKGD